MISVEVQLNASMYSYDPIRDARVYISLDATVGIATRYWSPYEKWEEAGLKDWFIKTERLVCPGGLTADAWVRIQDRIETDPTCPFKSKVTLSGNTSEEVNLAIEDYLIRFCNWVQTNLGISLSLTMTHQLSFKEDIKRMEALSRLEKIHAEEKLEGAPPKKEETYYPSIKNPTLVDVKKAVYAMFSYDVAKQVFETHEHTLFELLSKIFRVISDSALFKLWDEIDKNGEFSYRGITYLQLAQDQVERIAGIIYNFEQKNPGKLPIQPSARQALYCEWKDGNGHYHTKKILFTAEGMPILPAPKDVSALQAGLFGSKPIAKAVNAEIPLEVGYSSPIVSKMD